MPESRFYALCGPNDPLPGIQPGPALTSAVGGATPLSYWRPSSNFPEETYYPLPGPMIPGTGSPAINRFQFMPFVLGQRVQLDRFAFVVFQASGVNGVARCGLYNANQTTLKPTTLIQDGGEQITTTTGIKATVTGIILEANTVYCTAFVYGVTAGALFRSVGPTSGIAPFLGHFASGGDLFTRYGWEVASAYAAFSADLSATPMLTLELGDVPTVVYLRVAALL